MKFIRQGGPIDKKYQTWKHSISVFILHYIISTILLFQFYDVIYLPFIRDKLHFDHILIGQNQISDRKKNVSGFLMIYFLSLCLYRHFLNTTKPIEQKALMYEHTWLCNQTLIISAICLRTDRDLLAMAYLITVSIDQIMWYVDIIGFILFRTFPVGVVKYLTWPGTSFATRLTCTHHVWTIPLVMYACHGIHVAAYPLSAVVMTVSVLLSRFLTPFTIQYFQNDERCEKYLNINLSHELWKDITFSWLQIQKDDPPLYLYLFRLLWRWQLFNGIIFCMVLYPLSNFVFSHEDI